MISTCRECGEEHHIELNNKQYRMDGKRIFYPDVAYDHCRTRCRGCGASVIDSVPGAEFELSAPKKNLFGIPC